MEVSEQIKVMQYFADGGEIEIFNRTSREDGWVLHLKPKWNWLVCDYRIKEVKPEPVYYYRWKNQLSKEIVISSYKIDLMPSGWKRIESSKTTFEELV